MFVRLLALVLAASAFQDTGVLRVRVTVDGAPIPRLVLLISDNPSTIEPRRVRTGADGTVELKLPPGLYTVESDQPLAFGGKAYVWTQMITVPAGGQAVLDLGAQNAATEETSAATSINTGSALLAQWQNSVVEIWTPTTHISGFLIDPRGLIATSHHALRGATAVEVEIAANGTRVKVPGQVVVSERLTGAAIVRIDRTVMAAMRPIDPGCGGAARAAPAFKDELTAVASPMFAPKSLTGGAVTRITSQAVFSDMRLARDSAGSPVFANSGELLGIGAIDERDEAGRRWTEAWVVPIDRACDAIAAAEKRLGEPAPRATHLPLDPAPAPVAARTADPKAPKAPRVQPPTVSSSDFDITLMTPRHLRDDGPATSARYDFANWTDYVRDAPPVLMVRVSPQFEESLWKTIARGAAATQGMAIPALRSFTANFQRLRAYCGDTEVAPIHPFVIERQISDKLTLREGLYVFDAAAFGTHCASVRLAIYSEKDPQRADTRNIDPKLFQQVTQTLQ
jgi:S1-C subfamily serine protease